MWSTYPSKVWIILTRMVLFSGQLALINSSVLIVGAGGLGCPSAVYLAAAGVGKTFHFLFFFKAVIRISGLNNYPFFTNLGDFAIHFPYFVKIKSLHDSLTPYLGPICEETIPYRTCMICTVRILLPNCFAQLVYMYSFWLWHSRMVYLSFLSLWRILVSFVSKYESFIHCNIIYVLRCGLLLTNR